jgi:hypothetical protein
MVRKKGNGFAVETSMGRYQDHNSAEKKSFGAYIAVIGTYYQYRAIPIRFGAFYEVLCVCVYKKVGTCSL